MVKRFLSVAVPLLTVLLCCGGCMSFDYVGQKFDPKPDSAPVTFFEGRENIPPDTYRIIGRGVLSGSAKCDDYDRKSEMRAVARKYGADAVCVIDSRIFPVGLYPRANGEFAPPASATADVDDLDFKGEPWQTDSFGEVEVPSNGEVRTRNNFEVRVLLLKNNRDFEEAMNTRKGFL